MLEWIGVPNAEPIRYPQAFERRTYRGGKRTRQGFCLREGQQGLSFGRHFQHLRITRTATGTIT
jgi:hypothetical protein